MAKKAVTKIKTIKMAKQDKPLVLKPLKIPKVARHVAQFHKSSRTSYGQ